MKCSHTRPTAPRSTASAAKTWPSLTKPGTQQKRSPGTTRRLSWVIPPIRPRGVPHGLNDLDVVEEEVHLHGVHGRLTALHASATSVSPSRAVVASGHVMSWAWALAVSFVAPEPVLVWAPGVVGMS